MRLPAMTKPCKDCPFRTDCLKGWFGLGNYWNSGRLDVDGSLTESLST